MKIYPQDYSPISGLLISIPVILFIFFPYLQSEILTRINSNEFDSARYCKTQINPDFKQLKIIYLEKQRGIAKFYCLYEDSTKNFATTAYYVDQKWFVEYSKKLIDGFYWPVYY